MRLQRIETSVLARNARLASMDAEQTSSRARLGAHACCASAYSLLSRNLRLPLPPPLPIAGPSPRSCVGADAQVAELSSEEQLHRKLLVAP